MLYPGRSFFPLRRLVPSVTYHPQSPLGGEQLLVEMSQKSFAPPATHSINQEDEESTGVYSWDGVSDGRLSGGEGL